MSARRERPAEVLGAGLAVLTVGMLLAAPIGVLLGGNVFELAVVAISGVGLALLHLAIVVATHGRAIARRLGPQIPITVGGGGGGGGAGNVGRPPSDRR